MRVGVTAVDAAFTAIVASTQTATRPPAETARPSPPAVAPGPPLAGFVPLIGFLLLLGLATVFNASHHEVPAALALVLLAVTLAACSLAATVPVAILLTACAFLDYDGFVVGQQGQLSWHGGADVIRLAVFAGAAFAGLAGSGARRLRSGTGR